jgi:hypothetical protein
MALFNHRNGTTRIYLSKYCAARSESTLSVPTTKSVVNSYIAPSSRGSLESYSMPVRTGVTYLGNHDPHHSSAALAQFHALPVGELLLAVQAHDFLWVRLKLVTIR